MPAPDPIWVFINTLEKASLPYFVTGSVASIFYGEPRLTHDIDLILHLENNNLKQFSTLFPLSDFYCPPEEVLQIEMNRRPYGHFNLIHHVTGFKADIYLEGREPLHKWAFEHRKRIELTKDLSLWLAPPEYVIIRKLEFYREGGSDKHLRDIQSMLPQVKSILDNAFLNTQITNRGLEKFWQQLFV